MNLQDAKPNLRVIYVPSHAFGNLKHKHVEYGTISSINKKYVFVKFDKYLNKFGWDVTISQSCDPIDLQVVK